MANIAQLFVTIGADISGLTKALTGAESLLGGSVGRMNGFLSRVGEVAFGQLIAMNVQRGVDALGNLGSAALSAAADMQNLELGMQGLAARELIKGGASPVTAFDQASEAAQRYMRQLREISLISPYESDTVSNMFRLQMSFGATGETAMGLTKALLDQSAMLGLSSDASQRMAYSFGQVISNGKIMGPELRELKMVGLDMGDVFKRELGLSIEQVNALMASGKITVTDFANTFIAYSKEMSGGAAARMSRTWTGLKSSFSDLFTFASADLLKPVLDKATAKLGSVFDQIRSSMGEGTFAAWGQQLSGTFDQVTAKVESMWAAFRSGGVVKLLNLDDSQTATLQALIVGASNLANILWGSLGTAFAFVKLHATEFQGALIAILGTLAAFAAISAVIGLISALTNPLVWIIALAGILGAAWAGNWGDIQGVTASVISWINANVVPAFNSVVAFVQANWPTVQQVVTSVMTAIQAVMAPVVSWLQGPATTGFNGVVSSVVSTWPQIQNTIGTVMSTVQTIVSNVLGAIEVWWTAHGASVKSIVDSLWWAISMLVSTNTQLISQTVQQVLNLITSLFATNDVQVRGIWSALWESIKSTFTILFSDVSIILKAQLDILGFLIDAFAAVLRGDWGAAWEAAQNIFTTAWDAMQKVIGPKVEVILNLVTAVGPGIVNIFNSFVGSMRDAGNSLLQGLIDGINSKIGEVKQSIADLANQIPAWIKDPLGIHSPSTVMFNTGNDLINGLLFGWDAGQPGVKLAVAGTVDTLTQGVDQMAALKAKLKGGAGGGINPAITKAIQQDMGGMFKPSSGQDFLRASLAGTSMAQPDAWDEQARRMADIEAKGKKSQWFTSMQGQFNPDIVDTGGNALKAAAQLWQQDFYAGMKPDQIDMAAMVGQYKESLQQEMTKQKVVAEAVRAATQDPDIVALQQQLLAATAKNTQVGIGQGLMNMPGMGTDMLPGASLSGLSAGGMSLGAMGGTPLAAGAGGVPGAGGGDVLTMMASNVALVQPGLTAIETSLQVTLPAALLALGNLWLTTAQPAFVGLADTLSLRLNPGLVDVSTKLTTQVVPGMAAASKVASALSDAYGSLAGAVEGLNSSLSALIANLSILATIDFGTLQPGSPTPFELGLRGIARAADDAVRAVNPFVGADPLTLSGGNGGTVQIHLHVGAFMGRDADAQEFADTIIPYLRRAQRGQYLDE